MDDRPGIHRSQKLLEISAAMLSEEFITYRSSFDEGRPPSPFDPSFRITGLNLAGEFSLD